MSKARVLIIDDEADIRELLEITLSRMNIESRSTADIHAAKSLLVEYSFDLCLTDMRLPDGNGIELVRHIQSVHPKLPVAVITAYGNMESAIEALKAGAFDFVSKPVDLQVLRSLVNTALRLGETYPQRERRSRDEMLGDSPAMRRVRAMIYKLSRSQAPVHISGESGTGKELVARLVHKKGPRSDKPFVPVNCGAIPPDLMESEFFGHKKGSFTGAVADKQGLFQAADGGTLFLDEVAELPLAMQVKLLRAIQEKSVRPVGSQKEQSVDVRILCATHRDLAELVKKGDFRQDLYYRINVIELRVPPLRERVEDIPDLASAILQRIARSQDLPVPELTAGALRLFKGYSFPGNVRELENILERATALMEEGVIREEDLQLPQIIVEAESESDSQLPSGAFSLDDHLGDVERRIIARALEATHWNKTAAARRLGLSFRALRYRLKRLGME
jgi:two-component system response regulator PilR (NtrC family)